MPKRVKKVTEEFVPIDRDSLGHGVEISMKPSPTIEDLTKIESTRTKLKQSCELIISEKPQAASKISYALSEGKAKRLSFASVPYFEFEKDNKKIIVACAVGHLFTLTSDKKGWPVFEVEWKENFKVRKKDFSEKYYSVLSNLVKNADEFTLATDYDIEGELIGLNIIRFIAKQKDANRMKFSTLTAEELKAAYENKKRTINWGQAIAGETRHILDWFYGVNLSRALMEAFKTAGRFKVMSIGRIQGPTLKLIVDKERAILTFKPQPYWEVFISTDKNISLKYSNRITKKGELQKFKELLGKKGIAHTIKTEQRIAPLPPFDLTTLQIEAYKFFNINPAKTLEIAQNLYLAGLISYPRTSSQKLPEAIGYKKILEKLIKKFNFKNLTREKPIEGQKSDPAHPSIYPTGEFSELRGEEKKIYELVVRRFAACFAQDALLAGKKIEAEVDGMKFQASGIEITKKGWFEIYPLKMKEVEIPDLNGPFLVEKVKIEEKETKPPKRYTPASLVRELERKNLGTKATRSTIIETLYERGYIQEQSIRATPLGIRLIETLEKNSPIIIDENLTRHFEKEMDRIQSIAVKQKLEKEKEKILDEAKKTITKISQEFKEREEEIGKELVKAQEEQWQNERDNNKIDSCRVCKNGSLRILFNKKLKRNFVACSNYPECKTTYSLPPGLIKKTEKICEKCGFPKLLAIKKGKKPWEFCFNEKNHSTIDKQEDKNRDYKSSQGNE